MFDLKHIIRPNVKALTPYSSARDDFSGSEGVFLDANENPYGTLNRYPDPYQKELKRAIGKIKNTAPENIFLGNGSDEVIDICFRTFCNPGIDKAVSFTPTYGMYGVSAEINNVEMIKIPLNDSFHINYSAVEPYLNDEKVKLIFICSPNNPTANSMKKETVERIIDNFKGMVIIDEAYIDFSGQQSMNRELDRYPNLIVMQTFSKAFGLASVRVGMAFANTDVISYFNKIKPPYNISRLNQQAVIDRLQDLNTVKRHITEIISERENTIQKLKELPVIEKIFPSDANFVLAQTIDANGIYHFLVDRKIIVRNRHSVVNNCLRITIGTPDENRRLIEALKTIHK